ncbi:MAG: hypothetical protein RXR82_07855 [Nitrososphaeria archaeon]
MDDGLQVPDCSTMKGRVNGLGVDLGDSLVESKGPVGIAVDASGIESRSTTEGTDEAARRVGKGYLKMRFAVDIRTGQAVSMDATSERWGTGGA